MTTDWHPMETAPKDGTILDVKFDPASAEVDAAGSLAEFYAPGCTRKINPSEPIIESVYFQNRHFRLFVPGLKTTMPGIVSVTLTHWRLHVGRNAES